MTNEDLDTLEALAAAATPGPWEYNDDGSIDDGRGGVAFVAPFANVRTALAHGRDHCEADGRFIAAARAAVPALVAEVRRLRVDLARRVDELVLERQQREEGRRQGWQEALACLDEQEAIAKEGYCEAAQEDDHVGSLRALNTAIVIRHLQHVFRERLAGGK